MKFRSLHVAPSPLVGEGWGEGAVCKSFVTRINAHPLILAFSPKGRRKRPTAYAIALPLKAGLSHLGYEGYEEAIVPPGFFDFSAYGGFVGMSSEKV
ncbi:MAG: hypothetical protein ACOY15_02540, partial [Pseudomonadota bacterium]